MTTLPPGWSTPTQQTLAATELLLNAYLQTLPEGWHCVTATDLHRACGSGISLQMFSRHLKELNIPKRHTSKGTQYAFKCP